MPTNIRQSYKLENSLVLFSYMFSLFWKHLDPAMWLVTFGESVRNSLLEDFDEEWTTGYYSLIASSLEPWNSLTKQQLLEYDMNIVRHTKEISSNRHSNIKRKYFQYLCLLFTEIFIDKYFSDKNKLKDDLNTFLRQYNFEQGIALEEYTLSSLTKIAFWSATGSWKTLLMHTHIKQYLHYAKKYQKRDHNKILLVTPNEWLSKQHLLEFSKSGIHAEAFNENPSNLFNQDRVEVIEITKLKAEAGEKTVAIDSFETNNIVLIDEWHRWSSGDIRKEFRDKLSENGFAFEYSATFGQAVNSATGKNKKELRDEYSKAILFDYSYKYFYHDGYGKEYRIFNIKDDAEQYSYKYLLACLLWYYQQHLIYAENTQQVIDYNIEKPLWVFVWSKVTKTLDTQTASDVIKIAQFFQKVINDAEHTEELLKDILDHWLIDHSGNNIFDGVFQYLRKHTDKQSLYSNLLQTIFHTKVTWATLYIDFLKWAEWELWMRIWDNPYFGVINVWDDTKLFKLAQDNGIDGIERDFSDSLFDWINEKNSLINLLIGSKKFTEWRSSRRVSTMGLMNIGRSEWSQIIQLFGRGVRLKWYDMSLKRSSKLDRDQKPEWETPQYIQILETLNVFGIKADYMTSFKEYLEREWLPGNSNKKVEIKLPTFSRFDESMGIQMLKKKDEYQFKKSFSEAITHDPNFAIHFWIELDLYPQIESKESVNISHIQQQKHKTKLYDAQIAFLNRNKIYFEIKQYKNDKWWYNISIDQSVLKEIMQDTERYLLYIQETDIQFRRFEQVRLYEEITIILLKKYIDKRYNTHKWREESKHLEIVPMTAIYTKENFITEYIIEIDEWQNELIEFIQTIEKSIHHMWEKTELLYNKQLSFLNIPEQLYFPLIRKQKDTINDYINIIPTHLNDGEKDFLIDLRKYISTETSRFQWKNIYVMRNNSRTGMWFFESHGFYPDFILWIIEETKQSIVFIDPKWISRMWINNEKIQLHQKLKDKQNDLNSSLQLFSFILSATKYSQMVDRWTKEEFKKKNVLFQDDQWYIKQMFDKVL